MIDHLTLEIRVIVVTQYKKWLNQDQLPSRFFWYSEAIASEFRENREEMVPLCFVINKWQYGHCHDNFTPPNG